MGNARQIKNAQEKAAQLRLEAERAQTRRRNFVIAVSTVSVIAVVIGFTVLIRTLGARQSAEEAAASAPPKNVYIDSSGVNGILYGKSSAKVTLIAYEDFLCPACKDFESLNTKTLRAYADAGKIKVIYRPVAILDSNSTTGYSTRAGSAAGAILDIAPDKFIAFHDALFASQPKEGGPGLSNAELVDKALQVGVPKEKVQPAITAAKFGGWLKKATDDFAAKYTPSTPTIVVNGTKLDSYDPTVVKAALDKALVG